MLYNVALKKRVIRKDLIELLNVERDLRIVVTKMEDTFVRNLLDLSDASKNYIL